MKYSYLIQIIFKQIYLTHRWDSKKYNHSGLVNMGVMAMKGYTIKRRRGTQN